MTTAKKLSIASMRSLCQWTAIATSCVACMGSAENPEDAQASGHTSNLTESKAGSIPAPPWEDELSFELLTTMRRQEALQPAVTAIYETYMRSPGSAFAGIEFEPDSVVLYYKGQLSPAMTAAVVAARKYGPTEVRNAAFSLAELEAENARIEADEVVRGRSDIQSVAYRVDGSGLDIELMPESAIIDANASLMSTGKPRLRSARQMISGLKLAVPVSISVASHVITPMTTRLVDRSPWNGGDRFTINSGFMCTTGFGVIASGRSWILTAAHCAAFAQPTFQGTLPGALNRPMGPVNSDQRDFDMLLIDTSGSRLIFDGSPTTDRTKNVNSRGFHVSGELVCQSGATSGTVCGLRTGSSTDVRFGCCDSDGGSGYTVRGLIRTNQIDGGTAVRGGDSGGPVFTLDGAGVRAKGTVSAGGGTEMFFQDWADAIRLFGAEPQT